MHTNLSKYLPFCNHLLIAVSQNKWVIKGSFTKSALGVVSCTMTSLGCINLMSLWKVCSSVVDLWVIPISFSLVLLKFVGLILHFSFRPKILHHVSSNCIHRPYCYLFYHRMPPNLPLVIPKTDIEFKKELRPGAVTNLEKMSCYTCQV